MPLESKGAIAIGSYAADAWENVTKPFAPTPTKPRPTAAASTFELQCRSVEFLADFPDEPEQDDDETQVAAGNVAKALAEALTKRGYDVGALEDCFDQGWEFDARRNGSRFWLRVTEIEAFVLVTQDMTYRLVSKLGPYAEFLRDLHSVLTSDARFERIRWFQDDPPSAGGDWQPEPVAA